MSPAVQPCIICVAITGSMPTKANNPAVPITIAEQVESTHEAFEAGASIAHCHVRDDVSFQARPTTGARPRCAHWLSSGCSTSQAAHHDPQMLSSHTLPRICSGVQGGASGVPSSATGVAGAGLPTRGEGTRRGSRSRPWSRNQPMAANTTSGRTKRRALTRPSPDRCARPGGPRPAGSARRAPRRSRPGPSARSPARSSSRRA